MKSVTVVTGFVSAGRASADVVVEFDLVECARRRVAGVGALSDVGLLDALMLLPAGEWVPQDDLGSESVELLRRAGEGVVEFGLMTGMVRRVAVRPLRVCEVRVRADGWRSGARLLDRFAAVGERWLVLPDGVSVDPLDVMSADRFGVGVIADGVTVLPAGRFVQRWRPAGWLAVESLFGGMLSAGRVPD